MSGAEVLDLGREAIWLTVIIAAPVMLVGLAVGLQMLGAEALVCAPPRQVSPR